MARAAPEVQTLGSPVCLYWFRSRSLPVLDRSASRSAGLGRRVRHDDHTSIVCARCRTIVPVSPVLCIRLGRRGSWVILSALGTAWRNRTPACGFGDRRDTTSPRPCVPDASDPLPASGHKNNPAVIDWGLMVSVTLIATLLRILPHGFLNVMPPSVVVRRVVSASPDARRSPDRASRVPRHPLDIAAP